MISRCVLRWCCTLAWGLLLGGIAGSMLDSILFHISHDYVFPPGLAQRNCLLGGLILAQVLVLVDDWLRAECLPWRAWWWSWNGLLLVPVTMFLMAAGSSGMAKWGMTMRPSLAPPVRHAFCEGLMRGTWVGAVLAAALVLLIRRHQLHRLLPSWSDRLTTAAPMHEPASPQPSIEQPKTE